MFSFLNSRSACACFDFCLCLNFVFFNVILEVVLFSEMKCQ